MKSRIPTYTPRWLSLLLNGIDRLPVPNWLLFILVVAGVGVALHLTAWNAGVVPYGTLDRYLVPVGVFIAVTPAVWRFLDRLAADMFDELSREFGGLDLGVSLTRFLSMPPLPAFLLFAAGVTAGVSDLTGVVSEINPISKEILPWLSYISWGLTHGLLFLVGLRAVQQVMLMRQMFARIEPDLFNPGPIYTLPRYCAAFATTVLLVGNLLPLASSPSYYFSPNGLFYIALLSVSAVALFVFPLTAINRRMRRAKERLLGQLGENQRRLNARLDAAVREVPMPDLADLRTAVAVMKEQREVLERLPVWPWQAQTVRGLVPALLTPVVVYLIQRLLGLLFGL